MSQEGSVFVCFGLYLGEGLNLGERLVVASAKIVPVLEDTPRNPEGNCE